MCGAMCVYPSKIIIIVIIIFRQQTWYAALERVKPYIACNRLFRWTKQNCKFIQFTHFGQFFYWKKKIRAQFECHVLNGHSENFEKSRANLKFNKKKNHHFRVTLMHKWNREKYTHSWWLNVNMCTYNFVFIIQREKAAETEHTAISLVILNRNVAVKLIRIMVLKVVR